MSNLIKTNVPGLYKDPKTNAFINTNEYVKPIRQNIQNADKEIKVLKNEIGSIKNEVGSIKNELQDIKQLILKIVDGKD